MSRWFPFSQLTSALLAVVATQSAFALTPADGLFENQWALNYNADKPLICFTFEKDGSCVGEYSGTLDSDMNAPEGWDLFSPSRQEVVIALIDTGIDTTHPDLRERLWKNAAEFNAQGHCNLNRVDDDKNGYIDDCYGINPITGSGLTDGVVNDNAGHGTQMAGGMIAAVNNLSDPRRGGIVGIAGLAPNVKVVTCAAWELKPFNQISSVPDSVNRAVAGTPEHVLECGKYFLQLKNQGVNIVVVNISGGVSKSLNGGAIAPATKDEYLVNREDVKAMIANMEREGILLVTATGNFGWDLDNQINTQIPLADRGYFPAAFDYNNIISVAATDIKQNLWAVGNQPSGSSWGRYTADVSAPGENLLTTFPLADGNDGYGFTAATSPATAYVTGLIAMIKANSVTSHYDAGQIRRLVISSGKKLNSLVNTTSSGKLVRLDSALNCSGQIHRRRQLPKSDSVTLAQGGLLRMEVQYYNCANSAGDASIPVRDLLTGNALFSLRDDARGEDKVAGDGIYTGTWTVPSSSTIYRLSFGKDSVTQKADVLTVNPKTIIVDNKLSFINWFSASASAPFYGQHYNWAANKGRISHTWNFNITQPGRYKVFATWPIEQNHGGLADNAQYVISEATKSRVVAKDQRSAGGAWVELGTFNFNAGKNTVTVKNTQHSFGTNSSEPIISNGTLIADAIKVEQDFN